MTNTSDLLSPEKKRSLNALDELNAWVGGGSIGAYPMPASAAIAGTGDSAQFTAEKAIFVGCYGDGSSRDLDGAVSSFDTVDECVEYCRGLAYAYSGLQFGGQCYCGNSFGSYGTSSGCTMTCPDGETCGGPYANDVYVSGVIGCFNDEGTRDLSYTLDSGSDSMTVDSCTSGCAELGYLYAGLQDGNQCFCGNSYGSYGQASSGSCWMTCTGDGSQNCGGSYANYILTATV